MKPGAAFEARSPSVWWVRLDLRLEDNPALSAAVETGAPVLPVYIWSPAEEAPWEPGAASRTWLELALKALDAQLRELGSRLLVRRGSTCNTLVELCQETGAGAVFWNRRYEPSVLRRDAEIERTLGSAGITGRNFNSALLFEPHAVANKSGKPFQVFGPFWRHCLSRPEPVAPAPAPTKLSAPARWPESLRIADLELGPTPDWAGGIRAHWRPGAAGAHERLQTFLERSLASYTEDRNQPAMDGSSSLSPHLHFGEISPRQIWATVRDHAGGNWRQTQFIAELGWREFSHHLLFHYPAMASEPLRPAFKRFPWRADAKSLRAWQRGQTGFPIVDAGMRQLWAIGWMHNRVRMIAASFLVKDLLISWQEGARWFWDTLVDADLAQNTQGWQWTSGCGADAAPYFRIFNPISQGEKFDPRGEYVRRWVPELRALPNAWIHKPYLAPPEVLHKAGVRLGDHYPEPIVSHAAARERALAAFERLKR